MLLNIKLRAKYDIISQNYFHNALIYNFFLEHFSYMIIDQLVHLEVRNDYVFNL